MSAATSSAVVNSQNQVNQMNAALANVQSMATAVLQFASKLQLMLNAITSLAGSQGVTPPSDVSVQTNDATAKGYSGDSKNPFYPAIGQWQNLNGVTPIGLYALTQAGAAFVDLPDSYEFNSGKLNQTLLNLSMQPSTNNSAVANIVNGTPQTGKNLAFVITNSDTGPNIPGSLSLPSAIFNLIPPQYLAQQTCTVSYGNTDTDLTNSYSAKGGFSSNSVGYLPMGAISQVFQTVLTIAATYLPTQGNYTTITSGLGGPFRAPPLTALPAGADTPTTSVKGLGNLTQPISQIPSNLNPTISNYTQQINSLVQTISQLGQNLMQQIRDLPHGVQS
jgi:hypothetical protein